MTSTPPPGHADVARLTDAVEVTLVKGTPPEDSEDRKDEDDE